MKKIFVLMACVLATPVMADFYYGGRTQNCDLESMRAALDRATIAGHGAVITTVDCVDTIAAPVAEYQQVEYVASYDNIETVDCVPGPIVYDLPESDCDMCY